MSRILIAGGVVLLSFSLLGCVEPKTSPPIVSKDPPSSEDESGGCTIAVPSTTSEASPSEAEREKAVEKRVVFGDKFPEVLAVEVKPLEGERWRFDVKMSSTYDAPQRYADAWRVLDGQNIQLGVRILGHDHASEQPFTRSHTIKIPSETKVVFVEGRNSSNGWSGQRYKVELP